ncbi:hypothetical protein FQR65_LT13026 [Abscondita terminalis]|nr:hypothetical protein FQR65_LT13026 [Abscondita terminalis]
MSEHKIFITGIAGIFPSSKDVEELYVTIDSKNATFSSTDSYWKSVVPGIPPLIGKQPLNEKFDAGYFGIHYRLAEEMHQSTKKLLELSFEAIMDAGINPHDLKGSKTGVFVGTTNIECDIEWMSRKLLSPNFGVLGSSRSSLSEWISYYFQLQGPSMTIDSACTSSFSALDCAVLALKSGRCDNALVCSVNIIQNPHIHQGFQYLGILDLNGNNDVFDDLCGGYIRSEATTSIFLQLSQNSYKLYAEVCIKTNSDGFKLEGLTYPCSEAMFSLFRDVYEENGANSEDVAFIETHITGTSAGFVEELNAIKNAFCDGRKLPLFIGSVKANIGHSEASSGLVSLIKILLGLQHNCILPNPDFHTNSLRAKNLLDANLVVATDRIPLLNNQRVIIGCNSFGLGGTNAHLALKHHNQLQLQTENYKRYPNRLVCFSARTKESLSKIAASIERNTTEEYLRLLQNIFRHNVCNYFYRGFTLLNNGKITKPSLNYCREKGQLCLIFPGASILSMPFLGEIKKSEALSESFKKICTIIRAINVHDLNLWDKMKKPDFGDLVLAVTILQLTTTDVLKNILQQPITLVESCCSGAIAAAFAIGVVSLENAILLALKLRKTIKTQNIMVGERCTFLHCPNAIKRIVLKELKCICVGLNTGSINQIYEKKCMPNQVNVIVGFEKDSGSLNFGPNTPWLQMLGRLYTLGFDLQLEKLYPNVNGPVKAPLISPLIDWDHSDNWNVLKFEPKDSHKTVVTISVDNNDWDFLTGHIIDGEPQLSSSSLLFGNSVGLLLKENGLIKETTDIVFENVQFHRITVIQNKPIVLTIYFSKLQDKFEIKEEDDCIVKGTIRATRRKSKFNFNWREFPTFNLEQKMNTKDFYKKLNLHGYNYRNTFCCLHKVNLDVTHAQIKWIDWTTFLDSMMQLCAFRSDLDKLNIPVQITQLFIDPELHIRALNNNKNILPVIYNTNSNTISAPGIEFGPILAMNIKKRSDREPVIEVYKFVPYDVEISLEESVLVNLQIAAENVDTSLTVIEVIDSFHNESDQLLCSVIERSQENSFMNVKDLCIYSCIDCEYPNFKVEKKTVNQLSREANFIILSRGSHRPNTIQQILQRSNCFVISREAKDFTNFEGAEVISIHRNYHESLLDHKFVWLEQLQMVLKTNKKVLLVAQNSDSGILGLMTSLKQEVGQNVACLFIPNCNREFNIKDEFYLKQLRKNISINVYKEGVWGSYRHLPFPDKNIECVHAVAFSNSNDISGVQYVEGSLTKESIEFEKFLIKVYYAALNFKDVVSVTGRISLENGRVYRSKYKRIGFEFAGVESSGKRLMGVTCSDAFSNLISVTQSTTCLIPENWSIEEAATVPACYMTVLYGLLKICRLKRGQSVLIHLGTGGVGQSAIHVALYYNCKIFVTVGSKKNREYIRTVFPMIPQCHIGNSRGTGFEQMILKLTGGKGVDLVINSLTEDQLLAGIRCVARRGTFLELGRYDQQLNKPLGIEAIGNKRACISFYLDDLLNLDPPKYSEAILLLENGIKKGYVKPLPRIVFNQNEIQDAFHYMNLGKHVGKILLNYADSSVGNHKFLRAKPRYVLRLFKFNFKRNFFRFFCDSKKVYIIIGGLGGFGIELTDWLIGRGAQKLILVSRSGATTGYQHCKLKYWNELGCRVMLSQDDLTTEKGCTNLLDTANTLGVVDGIFNLSVVLSDALFENQSKESFQTVLEPKASITHNMDTMARLRCSNLRYFVVFSSVTCGRGNLGQTNYGMANSIMERICEERVSVGYPALAIQWGIIGDVRLMSERYPKNQKIRGVTQQNISSCLDLLDVFLTGKEVIVSSLVCKPKTYDQVSKKDNFLSAIAGILAIKNINHVSTHSTLSSLGLDSTTNVQLKQFLGSEHSMYFSTKELQNMTLSMLMERKNMN